MFRSFLYPLKRLRNADNVAEVDNIQPMCITLAVIFSLILSSLLCLLKEIFVQYCDYCYYRPVYPELLSFLSSAAVSHWLTSQTASLVILTSDCSL